MARSPRTRSESSAAKPRLDRDTIIAAALEIASTPGVTSISFRDLGTHLGADPTSVYRHFRNKEELMGALLDDLTQRAVARVTSPPGQWRERLLELAVATLDEFERCPAIGIEAIVLTTHGPAERAAIELMLEAFSHAGLTGDDLVRHYALLASHVLSAASDLARTRAARDDGPAERTWLDGPILVDPREFPLIAEHSAALADLRDDDVFLASVELVLDSAERTAANAR